MYESNCEEVLVEDPIGNWADHMECADGLAGCEPASSKGASQPLPELACFQEDYDVLDISLDIHGLWRMNGRCCRRITAPAEGVDPSFLLLYCCSCS